MTKKDLNKWIMHHEIQRLSMMGFSAIKIANHLVMDSRTVLKYLRMTSQEFELHLLKSEERTKILSPFENFVKDKLTIYPDASTAQIHDWLKEFHQDIPKVSARSVYNFVMFVRQKYNIPVVQQTREYFPVEELAYGEQSQVDFGVFNMRISGSEKRKRVYFFAMVLSRSRMKYVWFSDNPFTGEHVCMAHEKAFDFFGGIPKVIVYDQDRTVLVDENLGDYILTETFKKYTRTRNFTLHFCRKADPESKGKIENVIQYVKKNLLNNRPYHDIETLNVEAISWLGRTANFLPHNYTKKSPDSEFMIEKTFLIPYTPMTIENKDTKMYHVRKTNTIAYKSNFYSLPIGTYLGQGTSVKVKELNGLIEISNLKDDPICIHKLSFLTGQTIVNSHHKRDTSSSIEQLKDQISSCFTEKNLAMQFLNQIHKTYPRYTRDHLQTILRALSEMEVKRELIDKALEFSLKNELYNGSEFKQVLAVFLSQEDSVKPNAKIILLDHKNLEKANQIPHKSNIEDYEKIVNPVNQK